MQVALDSLTGHNWKVYCKLPIKSRVNFPAKGVSYYYRKITISHTNREILHEIVYKQNYQNFRNLKMTSTHLRNGRVMSELEQWGKAETDHSRGNGAYLGLQNKGLGRESIQSAWGEKLDTRLYGRAKVQTWPTKLCRRPALSLMAQECQILWCCGGFFCAEYKGETCSPRTPGRQHEITGRETWPKMN